ncbi:MAG: DDE-type integrase/transposase/recombinase [Planctomycetota bacterium]
MRKLDLTEVQIDEIWARVGCRQSHLKEYGKRLLEVGDIFIWIALDRPTRLIPNFLAAKRTEDNCEAFLQDLKRRLTGPTELCTDGWKPYPNLIARLFPTSTHCVEVKDYRVLDKYRRRYAPPRIRGVIRKTVRGEPSPDLTISHVERSNLFHRMRVRRLTRLCDGFSRKIEYLRHHLALHFATYNFCWTPKPLKGASPAQAAAITSRPLTLAELIEEADWISKPTAA